jgi:hypothetical protein
MQAAQAEWQTSDEVNFPAIQDPSDPTGCTASVTCPPEPTATSSLTLMWLYVNDDGAPARVWKQYNLPATDEPEIESVESTTATDATNIAGGRIERIA